MAVTVTHPFVSAIPDGGDATLVRPSNWNATHSISGTLDVANGGTGVTTSTGTTNVVLSNSPTLVTPALGTPSALVGTNITGTASGLTAGTVTTNANLTGAVTSVGNAASLGSFTSAQLATALTDETGTGANVFATTPALTNPTVTNYVETLYSANTGTALTIDLANGTVQKLTLTGNATLTMPTAVAGKSFIIILAQDATGGRSVTWSTVSWPSATAPTITTTASKIDLYSFFSDGTSWYGATIAQNYT